ncbi:MAG TPA: mechanosensitive ion channel family protein [Candidatus Binataceae bacterium]|nr:mechanosensitive ion channel family protein [Candidatus Binataceae bacterium]
MRSTPLQTILGFWAIHSDLRDSAESIAILAALLMAFALRRRRSQVSSNTFILIAAGLVLDVASTMIRTANVAEKIAAAALVLFLFGLIRLVLEAVDGLTRRGRAHFSTIFKDLVMFVLWAVVAGTVLYTDFGFQPLSILTTTTVVAAVVGLALQESLSNVFSGLMLQLGKPFEPGDWVRAGNYLGRVRGIGWRSTTVVTRANERLEVPNSLVSKDVLVNFGAGAIGDEISVGIAYDVPPNRVREVLVKILHDIPHVLREPPVEVMPWEYGDSAIRYRIKFWIDDYALQERVHSEVVSNLWYAMRRHRIDIPFPMRTLELRRERRVRPGTGEAEYEVEIMAELRKIPFLAELADAELRFLVPSVQMHQFGAGEVLVRQGEAGDTMFIVRRGTVEVIGIAQDGSPRHLAYGSPSQIYGEGALLNGDPRTATIKAVTDVEVLEMNRDGFARMFREHPKAAEAISEMVAQRQLEREKTLHVDRPADGHLTRAHRILERMRELLDF